MSQVQSAKSLIEGLCRGKVAQAADILQAAEQMSINTAAVHQASVDLGVIKEKQGFQGNWTWFLPTPETPTKRLSCRGCGTPVDVPVPNDHGGEPIEAECGACQEEYRNLKREKQAKAKARMRNAIMNALNPATPSEIEEFDAASFRRAKEMHARIVSRPTDGDRTDEVDRGAVPWA